MSADRGDQRPDHGFRGLPDKTQAANVTYRHPSWYAPPPEAIANSSATLRESTLVADLKMVPRLMADLPSWIVS